MTDDTEIEEMLDWVHALSLPESEFRAYIRPHFDDTLAMETYIDSLPDLPGVEIKGRHRKR